MCWKIICSEPFDRTKCFWTVFGVYCSWDASRLCRSEKPFLSENAKLDLQQSHIKIIYIRKIKWIISIKDLSLLNILFFLVRTILFFLETSRRRLETKIKIDRWIFLGRTGFSISSTIQNGRRLKMTRPKIDRWIFPGTNRFFIPKCTNWFIKTMERIQDDRKIQYWQNCIKLFYVTLLGAAGARTLRYHNSPHRNGTRFLLLTMMGKMKTHYPRNKHT